FSAPGRSESEMPVRGPRGASAARRAGEEALLHEERLVHLLERARVLAHGGGDGRETNRSALELLDDGLQDPTVIEQFEGGPVGLTTIAAAVGEDPGTLEEVYEPFLMQRGFLARTPRGRCATGAAYKHFGFTPPRSAEQPTMFDTSTRNAEVGTRSRSTTICSAFRVP